MDIVVASNGSVRIGPVPDDPGCDSAVVAVAGGTLIWPVFAFDAPPSAVLDDVAAAQDWLWAVYGEDAAVAVDAGASAVDVSATPLVDDARRLAYGLWAQRWWPASRIDSIAALDAGLLGEEIAELVERCDVLGVDEEVEVVESRARAEDYALAAGAATATLPGALVLARGTAGTDWLRCPPGLVDASERAVSWELVRSSGATSVIVNVAAAPGLSGPVPDHLHPRARYAETTVPLSLVADEWIGVAAVSDEAESTVIVDVPHFGVPDVRGDSEVRSRIRRLASLRLSGAQATPPLLRAEIAAAADDSDF